MGNRPYIPKTADHYAIKIQESESKLIYFTYIECHKRIQDNYNQTGKVDSKCYSAKDFSHLVVELLEKDGFKTTLKHTDDNSEIQVSL